MKPALLPNGNVLVPTRIDSDEDAVELPWEEFTAEGGTIMDVQTSVEEVLSA